MGAPPNDDAGGDDDFELVFQGGARLVRDSGCMYVLQWDLQLGVAPDRVGDALRRASLSLESERFGLSTYLVDQRHRVLFVQRSGRVQLRLSSSLEPPSRRPFAVALATRIVNALEASRV